MKFTMADNIKVKVGDILHLVPLKEWEELKVKFADEEEQKRIADTDVKVVKINNEDKDCLLYTCEELNGNKVHTELVDSDISYVVRS